MSGIDYGMGQTNIDKATGIRYGIIPASDVGQAWYDSSEAYYGLPHCPHCGDELPENIQDGTDCPECGKRIRYVGEECYGDEAISFDLDDGEYKATQSGDVDIFIIKSPYYTFAGFCSPCAPGAGHLRSSGDVKTYCFDHDWFEDGKAPYKVFRVSDDSEVLPEQK